MIEKISLTDPVAHAHDRELRKWAMEKALYSMALADLDNTAEATTQITDRAIRDAGFEILKAQGRR